MVTEVGGELGKLRLSRECRIRGRDFYEVEGGYK